MVLGRGLAAILGVALAACAAVPEDDAASDESAATVASTAPADPNATTATRAVYANLRSLDLGASNAFDRRIIIGQQEADVSNRSTNGLAPIQSDIERLTAKTPALVSYELSHVNKSSLTMFDVEGFRAGKGALRERVLEQNKKGALVSFVWHMKCPKAAPNDRDLFAPSECPNHYRLEELLSRKANGNPGVHFTEWREMLDELADFIWSLKDENGELVPILFRPFHEHTGDWFWWGRANTPATWIAAWRETFDYLVRGRGLHNLLWVYCPGAPTDGNLVRAGGDYTRYYPGDAYADVIAFDRYDQSSSFWRGFEADLRAVGAFARAHDKAAAVAEVGLTGIGADGRSRNDAWFTQTLGSLKRHGQGFSYVALWRNAPWEKFIPEPNDGALANDFRAMASDPSALFAGAHDLTVPLHAY